MLSETTRKNTKKPVGQRAANRACSVVSEFYSDNPRVRLAGQPDKGDSLMALDRHEHSQLNEAKDAAGRAQRQGTEIKDEIRLLRNKVSALSVACQALWELLRDRT